MPDQLTTLSGWTKLWHPRGPQVTLPMPTDPAAAFAAVGQALDAGWLVTAPGLEEGEERETVGWVLRSEHTHEGKSTPFVLLYATNDAMKWSFLKVYFNSETMVEDFEYASKMKLESMPEYIGKDKPARGADRRLDAFIIPAPRPFQVIWKKNPKYNPDEKDATKKKPARLFVRWADQRPQGEASQNAPPGQADTNLAQMTALANSRNACERHKADFLKAKTLTEAIEVWTRREADRKSGLLLAQHLIETEDAKNECKKRLTPASDKAALTRKWIAEKSPSPVELTRFTVDELPAFPEAERPTCWQLIQEYADHKGLAWNTAENRFVTTETIAF